MGFITGSMTPLFEMEVGKNPNFNVLEVDPDTMLPVDQTIYQFDLDHANENDEILITELYSHKTVFDIPDLSPQSYHDHSVRVLND